MTVRLSITGGEQDAPSAVPVIEKLLAARAGGVDVVRRTFSRKRYAEWRYHLTVDVSATPAQLDSLKEALLTVKAVDVKLIS